jgi:hypothetical protein
VPSNRSMTRLGAIQLLSRDPHRNRTIRYTVTA